MEKSLSFLNLESASDREIKVGDQNYLFFGGTAYLGLNNNPDFINLYKEGLTRYGVNNGTSRNNNVQLAIYNKAEKEAAKRFHAESALISSSGYLSAQMAVKYFASQGELLYAPSSHPALWLENNPKPSLTFKEWISSIVGYINDSPTKDFVIVSNTMSILLPEIYDFSTFEEVHEQKNIHFLLDDSHGIGILENEGSAVRAHVPKRPGFRVTVVASMAKGLGIDAGVILSDKQTIDHLKDTAIYLGASPPAPAAMYTFIHADDLYKEKHKILQRNINLFRKHNKKHCIGINHFPGFYFPDSGLFDFLQKRNIIISSFSYPLPSDPVINRVIISGAHTEDDILTISREINTSL